jgi:hypothetical protein
MPSAEITAYKATRQDLSFLQHAWDAGKTSGDKGIYQQSWGFKRTDLEDAKSFGKLLRCEGFERAR